MGTVLFKGLLAHKRRLVGTFLAVFLGVAFLAGTLVLGDTLRGNFDDLFTEANAGTDVVVRHESRLSTDPGEPDSQRGLIDGSLVDTVRDVDGVAAAEPTVEGFGQLVGKNGDKLGGNGPPTLAGNWIENRDLNPYELVEGRAPRGDNEVVINRGAADWLLWERADGTPEMTEPWLYLIGPDGVIADRWGPLFDSGEVASALETLPPA